MEKNINSKKLVQRMLFRLYTILLEVELFFLRLIGLLPFHCLRRFFYRTSGMKIGKGSTIHMYASFYNPSNIKIGEDTIIGEKAVLDGRDKLLIKNHVDIASEVMIYNSEHDINDKNFAATFEPVIIEDYVFIGPRSIILPGVKIKKGAVIGAGAVVTPDVEKFSIVVGVPAKVIGERSLKDPSYKLGRAAWFR